MPLVESIPNVSEGRRRDVVDALVAAVLGAGTVQLLDRSSDPHHNRSVLTLAGEAGDLLPAILALYERAIATIDLRVHTGGHPRVGAVDVVPFVPLAGASMSDCVMLARDTAAAVADRFGLPVYLYEQAASSPARRNLAHIRRGGFEGLAAKMREPKWRPDFGPAVPHPSAGATVIGARGPLIAYNINLATDRLDIARAIAVSVRESSGGLKCVKAIPIALTDRGIVQVSMNLTNYLESSPADAFDAVSREAAEHGVEVLESEVVGLIPAAALGASDLDRLKIRGGAGGRILERRLRRHFRVGREE